MSDPIVKVSSSQKGEPERNVNYFEQTIQSRAHHYYLSEAIQAPKLYVDMIHRIRTAGPEDTVYIYLNTPGGRMDTTIQIINAIKASRARIVTSVEAEAHSAGTMIFLSGDEFIVNDNSHMLFHSYTGGAFGKGNELQASVFATGARFNKFAHDVYRHFLTPDEIERMLRGEDFWFDSDEIRERLMILVEKTQQDLDAAQAAEEKANKKSKAKTAKK